MAKVEDKTSSVAQETVCKICNVKVNFGCDGTHKSGRRHIFLENLRINHVSRPTRWIQVTDIPNEVSQYEVTEYFSKFGVVTCTYFPRNKPYCFVEFSSPSCKGEILRRKHWLAGKEITIKKIPSSTSNTLVNSDIYSGPNVLEKVSHKATIESQIKTFLDLAVLTDEDLLIRERFVALLTSVLQDIFPGSRLEILGSAANGMAFSKCVLDLAFFLPFERGENEVVDLPQDNIPIAQDVIFGKFPQDHLTYLSKENIIYFISKYLHFLPGFKLCHVVHDYGFPHMKFTYGPTSIRGTLSVGKSLGLANTQLLRLYGQMDFYIYALLMVLRFWGKRSKFVGDGICISSYAFNWLVIFYLQKKNLVPTVEKLASLSDLTVEAENWDCSFTEDLEMVSVGTKDKSFGELITGFFEFYSKFDFETNVICPRDGSVIVKSELISEAGDELDFKISSMSVQDVFDMTQNITSSVSSVTINKFHTKCIQQLLIWQDMIKNRKVCLKFLFESVMANEAIPSRKPLSCVISLSSHDLGLAHYDVEEVCNFVLEIFKRVLLFPCTIIKTAPEFKFDAEAGFLERLENNPSKRPKIEGDSEKFILEVMCQAGPRTWVGRKNVQIDGAPPTPNQRLDYEETISKEAVKMDTLNSEPTLHTFHVTFSHWQESEKLLIRFDPKTVKKELLCTVIPFVRKYISIMTEACLKAYLTSKPPK